jgi:hypothetical protein
MNYFRGIRTVKGAQERWRKLALEHHPDRGGSDEVMAEISAQYNTCLESIYRRERERDASAQQSESHTDTKVAVESCQNEESPDDVLTSSGSTSFLDEVVDVLADEARRIAVDVGARLVSVGARHAKDYLRRRFG